MEMKQWASIARNSTWIITAINHDLFPLTYLRLIPILILHFSSAFSKVNVFGLQYNIWEVFVDGY